MSVEQVLDLGNLTSYLHQIGFQLVKRNKRELIFANNSEYPCLEIILLEDNDPFSNKRILEAVQVLADLEGLSYQQMLRKIKNKNKDIFCPRILTQRVPLNKIGDLIKNFRNMLAYAASMETNPQAYLGRPNSEASKLIERCSFGHTFEGSFGLSFEIPISPKPNYFNTQEIENLKSPLERRVVERLLLGFHNLEESVQSGNPAILLERYKEGFNANICEALVEINSKFESSLVSFDFELSPEWAPNPRIYKKSFQFTSKAFEILHSAATYLKKEDNFERIITGKIIRISRDLNEVEDSEEEDNEYDILVLFTDEDLNQLRKIKVRLMDSHQKLEAFNAFKENKLVSLSGILDKSGKFWTLMNMSNFRIIDSETYESQ